VRARAEKSTAASAGAPGAPTVNSNISVDTFNDVRLLNVAATTIVAEELSADAMAATLSTAGATSRHDRKRMVLGTHMLGSSRAIS